MKIAAYLLVLCIPMILPAQEGGATSPAKTSNNGKALQSTGARIPAEITVKDNVNIEAVLLPPEVAKRVFGKNISDTYAAILVNVANRSDEATLLLHSVFIDYSAWGFSGLQRNADRNCIAPPFKASGVRRNAELEKWQAGVSTCEVSSVEYRIVRGQMLQAQPWTRRNMVVRGLELIGTIAAGYASFGHADVARFMNAFNGVGVPAIDKFWVDDTVGQLNRISDLGFRNDKAIPQQASDIIVAFFPIDRFLTPMMKKIYFESPALFFNPVGMALDPTVNSGKFLGPMLDKAFGGKDAKDKAIESALETLAKAPPDPELYRIPGMTDEEEAKLSKAERNTREAQKTRFERARLEMSKWEDEFHQDKLLNFVQGLSLSRVQLVISGSMTVDVDAIAPTLSEFECDEKGGDLWAVPGVKHCTIRGKYLASGRPVFPEAATLGISEVQVNETGSSADELKFTFRLQNPVDAPAVLRLRVTKSSVKGGKQIDSNELLISISYTVGKPSVSKAALNDAKDRIVVTGSNFHSGTKVPMTVVLVMDQKETVVAPVEWTRTSLSLPVKDIPAGTYDLIVRNVMGAADKVSVTIPAPSATPPAAEPAKAKPEAAKPK